MRLGREGSLCCVVETWFYKDTVQLCEGHSKNYTNKSKWQNLTSGIETKENNNFIENKFLIYVFAWWPESYTLTTAAFSLCKALGVISHKDTHNELWVYFSHPMVIYV